MGFSNYSIIDPFHVGSKVDKHVLFGVFWGFFCSPLHTTSFFVTMLDRKKPL